MQCEDGWGSVRVEGECEGGGGSVRMEGGECEGGGECDAGSSCVCSVFTV